MEVTGDSSAHRSGVVVRGAYTVSVSPRFPRLLRHFPLEVAGTVYRGFRWDATLLGASLRWLPPRRVTPTEIAEHPREVPVEVLSAALDSVDVALSTWVPESQSARDRRRPPRTRPARSPPSEGRRVLVSLTDGLREVAVVVSFLWCSGCSLLGPFSRHPNHNNRAFPQILIFPLFKTTRENVASPKLCGGKGAVGYHHFAAFLQ